MVCLASFTVLPVCLAAVLPAVLTVKLQLCLILLLMRGRTDPPVTPSVLLYAKEGLMLYVRVQDRVS